MKLNEVRMMAPIGAIETAWTGLTLFLEFDGIIKVVAENEDMELIYRAGKIYGYSVKFAVDGFVNACLLINENIGVERGGSFADDIYMGTFGFSAEVGTERYSQ